MLSSGVLPIDILMSVKRMIVGFTLAVVLGSSLAVIMVFSKRAADYIATLLELIRPIPPIAWIPIAILWFGIGDKPAFFIVTLGSFFPIFVNCFTGIRQVDPRFVRVATSFGADGKQLFLDVYLPLCLPFLISGMRIGLGVGWMSVITAELVGAQSGLGYMMQLNRVMLQTQNVMVGMIAVGILGFGMNKIMLAIERKASPWKTCEE
jgi:ABC-type nitrate/sulfonate/bicarbonate transport system permease component